MTKFTKFLLFYCLIVLMMSAGSSGNWLFKEPEPVFGEELECVDIKPDNNSKPNNNEDEFPTLESKLMEAIFRNRVYDEGFDSCFWSPKPGCKPGLDKNFKRHIFTIIFFASVFILLIQDVIEAIRASIAIIRDRLTARGIL